MSCTFFKRCEKISDWTVRAYNLNFELPNNLYRYLWRNFWYSFWKCLHIGHSQCRTEPTVSWSTGKVAPIGAVPPHDTPLLGEGRTEEAVRSVLEFCAQRVGSAEEKLLQNSMISSNSIHLPYRGLIMRAFRFCCILSILSQFMKSPWPWTSGWNFRRYLNWAMERWQRKYGK
jgi:hypothetical protein